jgi:hypothetical protein
VKLVASQRVRKPVYHFGQPRSIGPEFSGKGVCILRVTDDDTPIEARANSQIGATIDKTWMDDELRYLDEEYNRYMAARQNLSRFSDRTLKRYRPAHLKKIRFNRAEDEFMHRLVAAQHTYLTQSILCSKGDAHFAAALMAVSATECLLLVAFVQLKGQVKTTKSYKKILRRIESQRKKNETAKVPQKSKRVQFLKIVSSLRVVEQYEIASQLGLVRDEDVIDVISDVLLHYHQKGASGLFGFVRSARNQLHAGGLVGALDSYALSLDVMYSPDKMVLFHNDFALCSFAMMNAVKGNLDRIKAESNDDGVEA